MPNLYRSAIFIPQVLRYTLRYNPMGAQHMNKLIVLSASIALLTGCSAGPQVKSYTGPTGETVSTVRCTKETSSCFEKASEVCNAKSYRVIDSYRNAGGLVADVLPGPVTWFTMSIVCGPSDGLIPSFPLRGSEPAMPAMPSTQQTTCRQVGNTLNCTTY